MTKAEVFTAAPTKRVNTRHAVDDGVGDGLAVRFVPAIVCGICGDIDR